MKRRDFHYHLPESLIAQHPPAQRTASRLLCLDGATGAVEHRRFPEVVDLLAPEDLLIFNDTRVIPARLEGWRDSGGRVEVLVERLEEGGSVLTHVRASNPPRPGSRITLPGGASARVQGREDDLFRLVLEGRSDVLRYLEEHGRIPLPPYVRREDTPEDRDRYQTVFAQRPGAVAAPTAGLHFDEPLLERLRARGVALGWVTLHVGAGTFAPVREDNLAEHRMHAEWLEVPPEVVERIASARRRGGRVVAVGTTVVRALETAARQGGNGEAEGGLHPFTGETRLFITPGDRFAVVDALITNFHLPESTLLMLVCAFSGHQQTLAAYREAVTHGYRFFSYGDAMFMTPAPGARKDGLSGP